MARPEGWRLDRAAYPFSFVTETRFQDVDILGHINNVAMAALFENGRVRFNRSLGLFDRRQPDERWLIAAIAINYLAEAHFPDDIEIASGVGHIGTRSWRIDAAAFQNGHCVATCDTTIVMTDAKGSQPLPAHMLSALTAHLVKQPD
ncbi:acyl-CoA thioesterase [Sphingomonas colocasiae]|uniref:Acyl-CoA thioesterase n=1 Tax=Sphingomonas colocasiae TaxID=1848973 RepID=A0ABS7PM49_9SPHN|nr:acyl-CoA thioesterase [Sphingomonas colocasiae]MBY8822382.1 acyl-CoA thioesterase [Sphingomonas colocasiae]